MKNLLLIFSSVVTLYIVLNLANIELNSLNILILETTVFVFIFFLLSILSISLRLYFLTNNFLNTSFKKIFTFSLISYVFNIISFSGSGEAIKYYLLNKEMKIKSELVSIFILEKLMSVLSILIFFSFVFFTIFNDNYIILFFLILILLTILFKNNFFVRKIPYLNYLDYTLSLVIKNKKLLKIFLISLVIHFVFIIQFYVLTILVFQIDINLKDLFYISIVILIFNALPLTFSGFGARELAVMISSYFILFDFKKFVDITLSLGLANLLVGFLVLLFISFYLFFIKKLSLFGLFKLKKIIKLKS